MLKKSQKSKTVVDKDHIESLIQSSFQYLDLYEDFLLEEVGIILSTKPAKGKPEHRWGLIATGDGTTLTYLYGDRTAVCRYKLDRDGKRILVPVQDKLPHHTPVTFTRHPNRPEDWAGLVVPWEPKRFQSLVDNRSIYRLVRSEPRWGSLYRPGAKEPRNIETLWEGDNLDSLRKRYPKDKWPVRETGSKPIHFEQREKGSWKTCNDPR